ncbi:hypothetical protein OAK13_06880, partial [Candidatus Thioglobus sp.]|nr:hypothetical protein [Candidatus Thioglobus sp.]
MTNILVVERLTIFNLFIVIFFKFFKFDVYIYKFSTNIPNWRIFKFLSLRFCNFEDCIDIGFDYYGGKNGDAIDEVTSQILDSELSNKFIPFFTNVKDSQKKHKLLIKEYVIVRCANLNDIYIWIEGYFANHSENKLNIYLLGDICRIRALFLKIRSNKIKVSPVISTNFFIVINFSLRIFRSLYKKILAFINRALPAKPIKINSNQESFISRAVDTVNYDILYFPHQTIFYGDLFLKDNFYSNDVNSVFYPSNILHIEFE